MKYCVIDKKPQVFQGIEYQKTNLVINETVCVKIEEIYACLYCEELTNITFIVKDTHPHNVTLLLEDISTFQSVLQHLRDNYPSLEMSPQNKKINGYAAAVVAKLREGIETGIVDSTEQKSVKYCPVCGMECDPNIPYCMECGAEV